jgi:hypothetical protein
MFKGAMPAHTHPGLLKAHALTLNMHTGHPNIMPSLMHTGCHTMPMPTLKGATPMHTHPRLLKAYAHALNCICKESQLKH